MDDSSDSLAVIDCVCSVAAAAALLIISAFTLVSALRVLVERDHIARVACRRWALVATAAVTAWLLSGTHLGIEPLIPAVAAIAAVDCWLAVFLCPQPAIPQARARRRLHPS